MGDNTTFSRAYCNRISSHLWMGVVVVVMVVVVVVVVCSELTWPQICKVSSFNNANVTCMIIKVLMDLIAITCDLLPQF